MSRLALASAALSALALAGCAANGTLSPAAQIKVTAAFNDVCPPVTSGALDPFASAFNAKSSRPMRRPRRSAPTARRPMSSSPGSIPVMVEPLLAPYLAKVK